MHTSGAHDRAREKMARWSNDGEVASTICERAHNEAFAADAENDVDATYDQHKHLSFIFLYDRAIFVPAVWRVHRSDLIKVPERWGLLFRLFALRKAPVVKMLYLK